MLITRALVELARVAGRRRAHGRFGLQVSGHYRGTACARSSGDPIIPSRTRLA